MCKPITFSLFLICWLQSCQSDKFEDTKDVTVIAGHIDQPFGNLLVLSQGGTITSTSQLEDGLFYLEIPVFEPSYYTLSHGGLQVPLHLTGGYHLNLSLDPAVGLRSLRYQGRGAEVNQYLNRYWEFVDANEPSWPDLWYQGEEVMKDQVWRYKVKSQAFLDHYLRKNANLDPKFIDKERSRIIFQEAGQLLKYGLNSKYTSSGRPLSQGYYGFLEGLNIEDPDLLLLTEYQDFIINVIKKHALDLKDAGREQSPHLIAMELIRSEIKDHDIRSFLAYRIIKEHLYRGVDEDTGKLYGQFRKVCKVGHMLADAKRLHDQNEKLTTGNIAPFFSARDITGNDVSLPEFRGQVVFVDFWSTWNRRACQEIPYLDSLRQFFAKEPVAFISISLDAEISSWIKMMRSKPLKGIQLIGKDGMESSVVETYLVDELPRYLLIDKKGRLVDAFAPPPSSPELKHRMKMLLGAT